MKRYYRFFGFMVCYVMLCYVMFIVSYLSSGSFAVTVYLMSNASLVFHNLPHREMEREGVR